MESAETAAPAASIEEKREQTKKALVPLPDSISDLLNGGRVTDAFNRHCLTFTAMELTAIAESSLMSDGVGNNNIDMNIWLDKLLELANELDSYLAWHRLADPNAHEDLLQKALRCFRPIHGRYDDIRWAGYRLHLAAKYPCRSVIVPPPPHAAELEAGDRGGYLVGKKKLLFKHNDDLRLSSLYLSLFAQENVFEKEHLYMKWQSEGLTQTADTNCEEEDNCFSELVNWNIITPVAENCGLNLDEDHLCQWQLNPFIVEDLASKAAEKGFVFTGTTLASPEGGDNRATIPIRRLALHLPDPQIQEMLEKMDLDHIRSLLISGAIERITIPLEKFAYLVVLDIQGWENLDNEDLLKICKMFMLSYLSIRRTRVTKLPPQIKDLHILRTLDISCTQISELPPEVCNLSMLRVLDLRGTKIGQLPEQIARLHNSLKTLLIGGYGMITNSNETVIETEIPHKLITVVRLRTLAIVDLSECPASFVEVLGYQDTLWVLVITWSFHQCVDGAYRSALLSSIRKWRNLRSLTIHCGLGCSMEFLDSLDHPSAWLEKFKVTAGRFLSVPQWIKGLAHLTFLQITVCRLVPDDVKILADLIKLECLVLGLEFIPEKEIVIERDGFNELQRFSLDCPVPWLTFKQGAMPKLTYLKLKICSGPANQVSAVPSGLSNLRRITEVVICYSKWCSESSSIKRTVEAVRKQVGKHLNPIDLVINGIQQDIEAFDEGTEEATGSGTQDDVEAADEETVRTTTQIGNEIEEI